MKHSLRVRAEGLRKAEELSISVFLRFVGQSDKASWSLTRAADAELVLQALGAPSALPATAHLAWVADADAPVSGGSKNVLRRPLQVDAFSALLRGIESGLDVPAARQPIIPAAAPASVAESQASYRLLRWPGDELLQNQRQRKILASFLVSRHLSVAQLSALSGVGRDTCLEFIAALSSRDLLETRSAVMPGEAARRVDPGFAPAPATISTSPSASGLIGRLRKRLGLV
ncbi:MAG: hypothetical protein JWN73_318 [Betaproteobacteria bacterium]|nr:hypothetical protein [Betaproteobacteria bacterium]